VTVARRDEAAFVEFATSTRGQLRNTAYLLCGDWHLASDLTQEALVKVYVAWPRIERRGGEFGYAKRALINVFLDQRRKRSSSERPTELDAEIPADDDVADAVTDRAALLDALRQLPPRQRACVVLRYFDDLDVAATAAALGCTAGTVKSQTARGLVALRPLLAQLHTETGRPPADEAPRVGAGREGDR
jgi:RNA polymerase sigma-70 factor (sigma-E family)